MRRAPSRDAGEPAPIPVDGYTPGDEVATRAAFGNALRKLGELNQDIVVLDGDVKNSTHTQAFADAFPMRFFEGQIAEQNMAGAALGLSAAGKVPVAATFACFLTRAADFWRMAGHSRPLHIVVCGSHAGVSIGEDGPSQMGLEDIALFRTVFDSTVLHPCDAVSTERLTELAPTVPGIVYLRTARPKTPVIYADNEAFGLGGSKTLKSSARDEVTLVAAGVTVHEALAAQASLAARSIATRVIDAYSIKPIDTATLERAALETGALVVVEDHVAEGGLGEAVAAAVGTLAPVRRLAVTKHPRSGPGTKLLALHGIDRMSIEDCVVQMLPGHGAERRHA
jgi:transketolase